MHPASSVLCAIWSARHISAWSNVRESEIVQRDIISEMCASTVIFGWELNCKRQTRISLCLSLSSWQEQSQNFGWSSSWPRCSVQISATRWRWRPLHRLDVYCTAQRVCTVKRALVEQFTVKLCLFMHLWWVQSGEWTTDSVTWQVCVTCDDVLSWNIQMNKW